MSFGTVQKNYISAISLLDKREILSSVIDIKNEEPVFMDYMELTGREVVTKSPVYHYYVNRELYQVETINGVPGGTGAVPTVVLANVSGASSIRKGSLILAANGNVGLVTAFTADAGGDQATITAVDGNTLALANTQKFSVISNAFGEGSSGPSDIRYGVDKRYNQVQIFKTSTKLTDIEIANQIEVEFEGQNYYMNKAVYDCLLKHRADVSNALIFGRLSNSLFSDSSPALTLDGNAVQTTSGLNEYVEDYGINNNSATIGFTHYATQAKQMAAARCPKEYMVFEGIEGAIVHDNFLKNVAGAATVGGRYTTDTDMLKFRVSSFDLYDFVYHRVRLPILDHVNLINFTGSAGYQKRIFYLPTGKVKAHDSGQMVDRFRIRHMTMPGVVGKTHELNLGGLAPTPTSDESTWRVVHETRCGFEAYGADHFCQTTIS